MRKMTEKISLYKQDKLENKNLYKDYLRFNQNYNLYLYSNGCFYKFNYYNEIII